MDRVTEFLEAEFPDAEERALLLSIAAAPTDKTAKLVYADWLDERDDPRGEYVRLLVKQGRKKPTAGMNGLRRGCFGAWLSLMGELHQTFAATKKNVEKRAETRRGWRPTVRTSFDRGLWDFHYSGDLRPDEDALLPILAFLADPDVSHVLRSIVLDGHADRGRYNGTLPINLSPLSEAPDWFPYLESFATERGEGVIVGNYEEEGQIGKLLSA